MRVLALSLCAALLSCSPSSDFFLSLDPQLASLTYTPPYIVRCNLYDRREKMRQEVLQTAEDLRYAQSLLDEEQAVQKMLEGVAKTGMVPPNFFFERLAENINKYRHIRDSIREELYRQTEELKTLNQVLRDRVSIGECIRFTI